MNSEVHIELLDPRHVIMRFSSQEDLIQAWTRESLVIKAYYFNSPGLLGLIRGLNLLLHRFFLISLPNLPLDFLNPDYLKSIAGVIGRVLRFDCPTIGLVWPDHCANITLASAWR